MGPALLPYKQAGDQTALLLTKCRAARTPIIDFHHPVVRRLAEEWTEHDPRHRRHTCFASGNGAINSLRHYPQKVCRTPSRQRPPPAAGYFREHTPGIVHDGSRRDRFNIFPENECILILRQVIFQPDSHLRAENSSYREWGDSSTCGFVMCCQHLLENQEVASWQCRKADRPNSESKARRNSCVRQS